MKEEKSLKILIHIQTYNHLIIHTNKQYNYSFLHKSFCTCEQNSYSLKVGD